MSTTIATTTTTVHNTVHMTTSITATGYAPTSTNSTSVLMVTTSGAMTGAQNPGSATLALLVCLGLLVRKFLN
jgi:hypothetical protein